MLRMRLPLVMVLLAVVLAGCGGGSGSGGANEAQLTGVVNNALSAVRAKDIAGLSNQLTADVQLVERVGSQSVTTEGRDNVAFALAEYRRLYMDTIHELRFVHQRPTFSGDAAIMPGQLYIDADFYCFGPPSGRCRRQQTEDWTVNFRRVDGRWLISRIERVVQP